MFITTGGGCSSGGLVRMTDSFIIDNDASGRQDGNHHEGGGVYVSDAYGLEFTNSVFRGNVASGMSHHLHVGHIHSSTSRSMFFNNTFVAHQTLDSEATTVSVRIDEDGIPFKCARGMYMPQTPLTLGTVTFTGCLYNCPHGQFGDSSFLTTAECSGPCARDGYRSVCLASAQPPDSHRPCYSVTP